MEQAKVWLRSNPLDWLIDTQEAEGQYIKGDIMEDADGPELEGELIGDTDEPKGE